MSGTERVAGLSSGDFHKSRQRGGPSKGAWSYNPLTGDVSPTRAARDHLVANSFTPLQDYRPGVHGAYPTKAGMSSTWGRNMAQHGDAPSCMATHASNALQGISSTSSPASFSSYGGTTTNLTSTLQPVGHLSPRHRAAREARDLNCLRTDDIPGAQPQRSPERSRYPSTTPSGAVTGYNSPTRARVGSPHRNPLNVRDIEGAAPLSRTNRAVQYPAGYNPRVDENHTSRPPMPFASAKRDTVLQRPFNTIEYFSGH